MSAYPTLHEMGIINPASIDRYSVRTTNDEDILRLVYQSTRGSILPVSKRFRFERVKIPAGEDGSYVTEISPTLHHALAELETIVQVREKGVESQLELIREEMERMEDELAHRVSYIQSLVDLLESELKQG